MKDVGAGSRGMDGFSRRSSGGWGKTFQAEGTVSAKAQRQVKPFSSRNIDQVQCVWGIKSVRRGNQKAT